MTTLANDQLDTQILIHLLGSGHTESGLPQREGLQTVLCKTASSKAA